jgi:transcriptional regulator with XRE-family HTH domain
MPAMANASISAVTAAFGARVRVRRLELGLSQEKLADACGLHWSFVGQVERGQRNITLYNIVRLAHGLQLDPGELIQGLQIPNIA